MSKKIRPTQIEPFGQADVAAVLPGVAAQLNPSPEAFQDDGTNYLTVDDLKPPYTVAGGPFSRMLVAPTLSEPRCIEFEAAADTLQVALRDTGFRIAGLPVVSYTGNIIHTATLAVATGQRYLLTCLPGVKLLRFEKLSVLQ